MKYIFKKDTIYHFGYLAGIPYFNSTILNEHGVKSISIAPYIFDNLGEEGKVSKRNLPTNKSIYNTEDNKIIKILKVFFCILKIIPKAKLIHFYGNSLLPMNIDLFIFKIFRIPMIITWGGTDIRVISIARKNNPYFYLENNLDYDLKKIKLIKRISNYVDYVATDPELALYCEPYFKNIFINKQPCSYYLNKENVFLFSKNKKDIKFLHIPTRENLKGTQYFVEALEKLKNEGYLFDFELLKPELSQIEMKQKIFECDIYLDELRCGSYGMTAVEAIGLGKPTLTFIREDLISRFPKELPFVNSNPDNVYDNIKWLLDNKEKIEEISIASREYAVKYHSNDAIYNELLKFYTEMGVNF
ncbi:glycosyltransferase [Candidatus Sulfurimonas baltica]|uniref:Glycosyltransferase n=1 Tax=Candidatus Sulfurimonas baltica TaxID=2740404 RepID=A0A7S7LWJ0_9BACT|nr:glycosyltransferase [Candidatus Sulfurimonas baltica]QOY52675.1 glycosyltransferase [Candidatus Sulfurimonas baltica]